LFQIVFCSAVAYNERKVAKKSNLWLMRTFSLRFFPLFIFESFFALIEFIIIGGPFIGLIIQTLILRKSLSGIMLLR